MAHRHFKRELVATHDILIESLINPVVDVVPHHHFAVNSAVGNSVFEDVWEVGGVMSFPTLTDTISLLSTSAEDKVDGTGAQTLFIEGLDTDYNEINETISITGLTPKVSDKSYLRISHVTVITAGSTGGNLGAITITHTTTTDTLGLINIGDNTTHLSQVTAPSTGDFICHRFTVSTIDNAKVEFKFQIRKFGEVWVSEREVEIVQSHITLNGFAFLLPRKADFRIQSRAASGNVKVSAGIDIIEYKGEH